MTPEKAKAAGLARPYPGDVWKKKTGGKTETRTVIDRTLGGGVVYVSGRVTRHATETMVDRMSWDRWTLGARHVNFEV